MTKALMPTVGVVVANHNNEAYVAQAIESVAHQTVRDIRVMVVDDASTDDSDLVIREMLHTLDDRRFHYLRLQANRGQAGAIRCGLEALNTPFVCFLDSDDLLHEDFVARHLAAHLNTDFPVALTYCDSHVIDSLGQMLAGTAWWFDFDDGEPPVRNIDAACIPEMDAEAGRLEFQKTGITTLHSSWSPSWSSNSMASMMFRRSFVDLVLVPPDEDLRLYVDFYLSTFAALLTGVIAIKDALYSYRMHGANKHSDGVVLGGQYCSSSKRWEPIRDTILRQVFHVLESEAPSLRSAFGDYRHEQAMSQIRSALRNSLTERGARGRTKLQEIFWGT